MTQQTIVKFTLIEIAATIQAMQRGFDFNASFGDNGDKISINILGATVSYKNGKLTFSVRNASSDLAESANILIDFISNDIQLDDITPIIFKQGDY